MRAVVDMSKLGENTVWLDCDVLQADGGTRTAAITGAYVALVDALAWARKQRFIERNPLTQALAAVSVGVVRGKILLDLDYCEDSTAEVDMNVAMTSAGEFVEVQGSAEGGTFTRPQLDNMLRAASKGIRQLLSRQQTALAKTLRRKTR
jgi:ribonuclease PH